MEHNRFKNIPYYMPELDWFKWRKSECKIK